ncbi:hypothetical protein CYMTET_8209 [Cymbomonas tetramitiformis]|uniref:Neutral ceramidase n=1 Tax=Cymbomonas tetramitiformis TaxID=36881 RepID=A0AAE0GTQ7_9CHLO|nr:hypothetical protein CYMTET_8209 [Cymbomonas tetramitiformis]
MQVLSANAVFGIPNVFSRKASSNLQASSHNGMHRGAKTHRSFHKARRCHVVRLGRQAICGVLNKDDHGMGVGTGLGDITGPCDGVGMMGYAMPLQTTTGILQRLWARAFVLGDADMSEGHVAIVVADLCMIFPNVKAAVVGRLKDVLGDGHYNEENLLICATHTHAGPGGFSPYGLYNITTAGFSQRNFDCIVDGIADAVLQAHRTFERTARDDVRASLRLLRTHISAPKAAINRSPAAYANNPQDERAKYDSDVDEELLMLHITRESASKAQGASNERQKGAGSEAEQLAGEQLAGLICWFATHGTSLHNSNHLISGDNKGYASYLLENQYSGGSSPAVSSGSAGDVPSGPFIAAFPQPASGDVSPNVNGVNCTVTGGECHPLHSTSWGCVTLCRGQGPGGRDDVTSAASIGELQAAAASRLLKSSQQHPGIPEELLAGPIRSALAWVDFGGGHHVAGGFTRDGAPARTAPPAKGYRSPAVVVTYSAASVHGVKLKLS